MHSGGFHEGIGDLSDIIKKVKELPEEVGEKKATIQKALISTVKKLEGRWGNCLEMIKEIKKTTDE